MPTAKTADTDAKTPTLTLIFDPHIGYVDAATGQSPGQSQPAPSSTTTRARGAVETRKAVAPAFVPGGPLGSGC